MKRICDICCNEFPENRMISVFTGRTHWLCWDCYKKAHGEAAGFEMRRRRAKAKEANKK